MNDMLKEPNQNPTNGQAESESISGGRQSRRERVRGERTETSWIGGAVLVIAGILFMAQSLGTFYLNNWWALFILIPAVGAFGAAWKAYQDAGSRLNNAARGSLFAGFVLLYVTGVFLFSLNWAILGPILIILVGVSILFNFKTPK